MDPTPSTPPPPAAPPAPIAPPTRRGTAPTYRPRAVWPTVIGVIGCVFGAGGALQGLGSVLAMFLMDPLLRMMGTMTPAAGAQMNATRDQLPVQAAIGFGGLLIAIMLLVSAIKLLHRKPDAHRWILWWAVIKIVYGLVATGAAVLAQQAQFAAIGNTPGAPPAAFIGGMAIVGGVIGVLWIAAFPVFILIWFSRPTVKEEIATW